MPRCFPQIPAAALLCGSALWASHGLALNPSRAIDQYSHQVWRTDNGLPQNSIQAILQTRDGYLWLATQEGLARFDGVQFHVFDRANTAAFASNHVQALFESRDGSLWVGTYGGGLLRLRDREFRAYTSADGLNGANVAAIAEDGAGDLWIAAGGSLFRLHEGKLAAGLPDGKLRGLISCVSFDSSGDLWIGTALGLARLHGGTLATLTVKDGLSNDSITALLPDRAGGLWVGTTDGLDRLESGRVLRYGESEGLSSDSVRSLSEDRDGNLWVGTNGGLFRFRDGRFTSLTAHGGLSSDAVTALLEGREGGLWVGTDGGGLNLLRDGNFIGYRASHGLASDVIYCVAGARDGGLWAGTYDGEVNHIVGGRITAIGSRAHLRGSQVRALYEDAAGFLWIGTDLGLYRFKEGKYVDSTTRDGLGSNVVRAIAQDATGTLWVGTDGGGLSWFAGGRFTTFTQRDGLAGNQVRAILPEPDGSLWIATYSGLSRFSGGKFTNRSTRDGLVSNLVRCLYQDSGGTLWIGTYGGGLSRLKDGAITTYTTREGLFSDVVYQILEDSRGNLWMSCNRGVYRVSKRELEDLTAGRVRSLHCVAYGRADGMPSSECNGGNPAGWSQPDGTLWFPTLGGIARVDPAALKTDPAPPVVVLEEALSDGRPLDLRHAVRLPPGTRQMEFRYTALDFVAPEKIMFSCKLEGFDPDWIEVGARRSAYYTSLSPGRYTFRVIARNNDGVWNRTGASLVYEVAPHFYQTWLFFALCGGAAVAAGWAAYRRRVRDLKKRERELLERVNEAVARIKTLSGLLPICAACKKIRDDDGYWNQIETYVHEHSQAEFTHSICPECMTKLYPDLVDPDARGVTLADS
jgi:ligand-binding sensor domain-containing protein